MNAFKTNADVSHHKKWKEYICNQSRNEYTFLLKYWRIQYSACDETKIFCIEFILPRANWFFIEMCFFVFINYCLKMYEHLNFSGGVPVDSWSIPYFHLIMRLLNLNKMNLSKHLYFHEDGTFKISLCFSFRFIFILNNLCLLSYSIHLCSLFYGPISRQSHWKRKCMPNKNLNSIETLANERYSNRLFLMTTTTTTKSERNWEIFFIENHHKQNETNREKTFEFQTLICSVTICVSNHWWRNS